MNIKKYKWYYEYCSIDVTTWRSHDAVLFLVRLSVFENDTAEVLFPSGETMKFANELDAEYWLAEEEFAPLDLLFQEFEELGLPADPLIKYPDETSLDSMLKGMRIPLKKLSRD